jgi:hypothetical protein
LNSWKAAGKAAGLAMMTPWHCRKQVPGSLHPVCCMQRYMAAHPGFFKQDCASHEQVEQVQRSPMVHVL